MDQSDLAWKLAQATIESIGPDPDALDGAFRQLKPAARDVARAYALCLTIPPFTQSEATRLILSTRLQVALMEEHVEAQRRMGATINVQAGCMR